MAAPAAGSTHCWQLGRMPSRRCDQQALLPLLSPELEGLLGRQRRLVPAGTAQATSGAQPRWQRRARSRQVARAASCSGEKPLGWAGWACGAAAASWAAAGAPPHLPSAASRAGNLCRPEPGDWRFRWAQMGNTSASASGCSNRNNRSSAARRQVSRNRGMAMPNSCSKSASTPVVSASPQARIA